MIGKGLLGDPSRVAFNRLAGMRTAVQRAGTKAIGRSRNAAIRRSEQGQWFFTSAGRSGSAAIAAMAASKESSCSPISTPPEAATGRVNGVRSFIGRAFWSTGFDLGRLGFILE